MHQPESNPPGEAQAHQVLIHLEDNIHTCAEALKAMADGTRLAVLRLLMAGERRVGEMQAILKIDQSLLSHHLQVLRRAGMVVTRREGKAVAYRLAPGLGPVGNHAINLGCCQIEFAPGGLTERMA